jgi:hypothetical protein
MTIASLLNWERTPANAFIRATALPVQAAALTGVGFLRPEGDFVLEKAGDQAG